MQSLRVMSRLATYPPLLSIALVSIEYLLNVLAMRLLEIQNFEATEEPNLPEQKEELALTELERDGMSAM